MTSIGTYSMDVYSTKYQQSYVYFLIKPCEFKFYFFHNNNIFYARF